MIATAALEVNGRFRRPLAGACAVGVGSRDVPVLGRMRTLAAALARCGLSRRLFRPWAMTLAGGETRDLLSLAPSGAVARMWTCDLDVYKRWLAVSDPRAAREDESPLLPDPEALTADVLDDATRSALGRVARAYLLADPRPVAAYKEVIERHFGPFEAVAVVTRHLTIDAGARLVVSGVPTILVADSLEIYEGGELTVETICHATIGTLTRHGTRSELS